MNIITYLNKCCDGNKAEFARRFGRLPQNVTPIFNHQEKWLVLRTESKGVTIDQLMQIKGTYKA